MSIFEYLTNRQIGKKTQWKLFEDIYPGSDINDWRRGNKIIKLRNQKKYCKRCFNNYQVYLIKIPDLMDIFGFETHLFYESNCTYCDYYIYIDNNK
jgi:hypothetical protein